MLRIGAADPVDPELTYFVQAVDRTSKHRLRVVVDKTTYYTNIPGAEAKLAGDVRAGKVPLAYVPSRDWAAVGDPDVEALQAPFAVTTAEATDQLANGPVGQALLAGLARYGRAFLSGAPVQLSLTGVKVTGNSLAVHGDGKALGGDVLRAPRPVADVR